MLMHNAIILSHDYMEDKEFNIESEADIINARDDVRNLIVENFNFSPLNRLHVLTVISELTRNIIKYANKGKMIVDTIKDSSNKKGIKLIFEDNGPGIPDIKSAMSPKKITEYHKGMGLGLIGSKRLSDEFDIKSEVGKGTTITCIKWEK